MVSLYFDVPRKKDRYFISELRNSSSQPLSSEDIEEVKICFRTSRILKNKVKEFVLRTNYKSENRVYEEATWKFITNYDYALQIKETIERSSKFVFDEVRKEYGADYQRVESALVELLEKLREVSEPLIDTYAKFKSELEKTLENGRYQVQTWIVYFVGLHGKIANERLVQMVLGKVSHPRWLIEDALALLIQKNLLREDPQGMLSLEKLRE